MQSVVVELSPSAAEVLPNPAADGDAGDAGVMAEVEARVVTKHDDSVDGGAAGGSSAKARARL